MLLGFLCITGGLLMIYLAIVNITFSELVKDMQTGTLHR